MMNLPRTGFALVVSWVALGTCLGQEAPRAEEASPPKAQTKAASLDDFEAGDRKVREGLESLVTTIDEEVEAGRVTREKTQSLRIHTEFLLQLATGGNFEAVEFHGKDSGENEPGNARITAASKALAAAMEARRNLYHRDFPQVLNASLKGAADAWRTVKTAPELTPTMERLALLLKVAREPDFDLPDTHRAEKIEEAIEYLRKYQQLLEAEETQDPAFIGEACRELRVNKTPFGASLSLKELEERRKSALRKTQEILTAAWTEMLEKLPRATKPEEAQVITEKLRKAAAVEAAVTDRMGGEWTDRYEQAAELALSWQEMLSHEVVGSLREAGRQARDLSERARTFAPTLATALATRAEALKQKDLQAIRTRVEKLGAELRDSLGKVESSADVEALLARLRATVDDEQMMQNGAREISPVFQDLEQLAAAWRAAEAQPAPALDLLAEQGLTSHPWRVQTTEARDRLRRRVLADWLSQPALLQPPLNALGTREALGKLAADASARADWRQLYDIVKVRSQLGGRGAGSEDLSAVRSFLTAQNLEKAEQWKDAVASYKASLTALDLPKLVSAAGDRLKALKQNHPEAFQELTR